MNTPFPPRSRSASPRSLPARRSARARPRRSRATTPTRPVDVAADRIEVQDRADRAIFSGNVARPPGRHDAQRRAADRGLQPTPSGIQIQRLDASGGVTVRSPSETARGQFAIYDLNRRLITMIGGVMLTQGQSQVQRRPAGARSRHRPRGDRRQRGRRPRLRHAEQRRPRHRHLHGPATAPIDRAGSGGDFSSPVNSL